MASVLLTEVDVFYYKNDIFFKWGIFIIELVMFQKCFFITKLETTTPPLISVTPHRWGKQPRRSLDFVDKET